MTLTEAIKHCEDVADYDCFTDDQRKCSDEHRQLADWLRELKERREKAQLSGEDATFDLISRQATIDVEGLDEQIRCEMCRNPMHTNRGCDGNCKYDEKLYERIMQILGERIKPLPSAEPRKKGEWILVTDNRGQHFECDKCGEWRYHQGQNFCSHCGADMREGEEEW